MITRITRSVALLCAALVLLPLAASAQQGPGGDTSSSRPAGPLIGRKIPRDQLGRLAGRPGADAVSVLVELTDEPTAAAYSRTRSLLGASRAQGEARRQLARIRQAQSRLAGALAPLGARELYRVQRVANGIAVRVPQSRLAAIAALPGVKALRPLVRKRIDNAGSVPLVGAPAVWGGATQATGEGTTIAVIDSGIDYLHPAFGGSGLKADYDALDTTVNGSHFPTAKVVGGFDLVGDDYDASIPDFATPAPDPNPIDCVKVANPGTVGHGSHVAGTAAGLGVLKSGAAYTGTYTGALNFDQFRIGPGVAPEAKLYAYRVFGCDGGSEVVAAAIDAAVDPNGDGDPSDHVDVINLSLGIDYGAALDYPGDPDITATNAAIAAGVVVVASAGNAGDTYYVAGGPSSADGAISVASSDDGGAVADGFRVIAPAAIAGDYPASNASRWVWADKPDVSGDLVYPPDQRSGCAPFSPGNTTIISGNIVLLDWDADDCNSTDRVNNAAIAGARGVILAYNLPVFDISISGSSRIPALLTLPSTAQLLKATLATQAVSVTLTKDLVNGSRLSAPARRDTLSSFSSRGPRNGDGALKPDITAPGETIFSVKLGPGGQGQTLSGTSMAAPHVAGAVALLRQLHPGYSVAELKALVMNTATRDLRAGEGANAQIYGPARVGAGRLDLPGAAAATLIAHNAASPELVSVSFGNLQVVTATTVIKQVTVTNKGAGGATFDVAYTPVATVPGVTYSASPAVVTLSPGATATVNVTLAVDAALTRHTHDPTVSETQVGEGEDWGRHWQSEASGYLSLTPQNATRRFAAIVRGYYENPPVESAVEAAGLFTYSESSRELEYSISFSRPITLTAGHIHLGRAGENGPVAQAIPGASGSATALSGTLTLSTGEAAQLLNGALYANFHTAANPNGELRGQIVSSEPALRVPVHAAVRAASATSATAPTIAASASLAGSTGVITLTGEDVLNVITTTSPLLNAPSDDVSIVTAFELGGASPQLPAATPITASTDLRYVGVSSDFRRTITSATPAGDLSDTTVYFGIATYGSWTTPYRDSFEVDIDVDRDGTRDYALFNTVPLGDASDIHVAALCALDEEGSCADDATIVGYVNVLAGNAVNTNALDNSVLVLPLPLSELPELSEGDSRFSYSVFGFDYYYGLNDALGALSYDPARPGVDLSNANRALGPAHLDLSGGTIPFTFSPGSFALNGSLGVLLLHHHGASPAARAEVLRLPSTLLVPIVAKP
jgi:subtilisin family serine protease